MTLTRRMMNKLHATFAGIFRPARMRHFESLYQITDQTTILDVGGTPFNWTLINTRPKLTFVNLTPFQTNSGEFVQADGCSLPFADQSFDIVYSNSVIEHLGSWPAQQKFAAEVCRVGRRVYVQTPNRFFFIEPHILTPFIHWLPKTVQKALLRNFSLWGWLTRPDHHQVIQYLAEIRLLEQKEIKRLFPGANMQAEKFLWMTKSWVIHVTGQETAARLPRNLSA